MDTTQERQPEGPCRAEVGSSSGIDRIPVNVWLVYKKDEPRTYTRTTEPTDELIKSWRADGFRIYRVVVHVPTGDNVDGVRHAMAEEVS